MRVSILKETKENWSEDFEETDCRYSGWSDGSFPDCLRFRQEKGHS